MLRVAIFNLFIALACMYFFFHLLWGPRGYVNYSNIKHALEQKLDQYNNLAFKRSVLESKASLLQKNSLDLDALDEYSRKNLILAKNTELVIPVKKTSKK